MKNVEVSEQDVKENKENHQQGGQDFDTGTKKKMATIASSQTPSTFQVQKESDSKEEETDPEQTSKQPQENQESKSQEEQEPEHNKEGKQSDQPSLPEEVTEKLAQAYPDKDFSSQKDASEAIDQLVKDSSALAEEREANKRVYELFENSNEMVALARAMDEGKSFPTALASIVDFDSMTNELEEQDPEEYKKMLKEQAKRETREEKIKEERKQMQQDFEENQQESQENIASFQSDKDMNDNKKEKFLNDINKHFSNIVKGKVTPEFLEVMHKGLNHDTDIEEAKEEGKIQGKNEKINAEKSKKKGDGLPTVKGGKPKKQKKEATNGKRAIAGIVSGHKSTFN